MSDLQNREREPNRYIIFYLGSLLILSSSDTRMALSRYAAWGMIPDNLA